MRVCLDTNVLVAAFASRGLCFDLFRHVIEGHDLVIGEVIIEELRRVLTTKLRLPQDALNSVEATVACFTILPRPKAPSDVDVRDPDDRWVLATAIEGAADVLVTGDKDLPTLAATAPLPIVSPRTFMASISA
jgi:putative PIN family toxin of toxin-antitoxin system